MKIPPLRPFFVENKKLILKISVGLIVGIVVVVSAIKIYNSQEEAKVRKQLETEARRDITAPEFLDAAVDQANLMYIASMATLNGQKDADAAQIALKKQTFVLSNYISKIYGDDKKKEFETLWNDHHQGIIEYAYIKRTKDNAKLGKALTQMTSTPIKLAEFFDKLKPGRKKMFQVAFTDQTALYKTIIDAYDVEDYTEVYNKRDQTIIHTKQIATVLQK